MPRARAAAVTKKPICGRSFGRRALLASLICAVAGGELGCSRSERARGSAADAELEAEASSITRWSERHELFVELPPPRPSELVGYHVHVTRLVDFQPVTAGTLRVRFKTKSGIAAEATQVGVKRPGIFVFDARAPRAGSYTLEMSYEHEGQGDVFDCGALAVGGERARTPAAAAQTSIAFLKESQWKVPFATAWAAERLLARELELPATVEPAATDQLTVGAPTGGRFFHDPKRSLTEGQRIRKGDVLGAISPTVAGDDFSRLQQAVEQAKLAKAQLEREIARVEPLVEQGLVPGRRLIELRNELEQQVAQLRSAGGRLSQVTSPGGAGGIAIKSTLEGVISEVLVPNGEAVAAGAALVRIVGTDQLWVRARFIAKPRSSLLEATPAALRLPSGEQVDLRPLGARFLSTLPAIDPESRIATWIVDVTPHASASAAPNLRAGENVVLTVRVGAPKAVLAVPRSAVVEINTRPYVFVQIDGEHFDKRPVSLGHTEGPWVHVAAGLAAGERVVTTGGFDIHLASLMGSVESHRH